ncbi:DMT family transporter [Myxococcaceae bacterium GXIMD 01537]
MPSILLVLLGACSYGALSTFVKFAYAQGFTTGEVVGSQTLLGAGLTWLVALAGGRVRMTWREALLLLVSGMPMGLTGILYYSALRYVTASLAVVLLFQFTWMGVLVESLTQRRWPGPEKLLSLTLLLVGTVVAGGVLDEGLGALHPLGVALGLLAAVSYTLVILFSGRVALGVGTWARTATLCSGSALVTLCVFPPAFLASGALGAGLWKWASVLGFLGLLVPTFCFARGMPKVGAGLGAILGAAELPTATLLAATVLGEHVGPVRWLGVALVLAGIILPELWGRAGRPPLTVTAEATAQR